MSEPWNLRRDRLLKVREGFPESLREIPVRYVEDVGRLGPDALRALERAYRVEVVNIPRALKYMRENLVLSVEDMIEFARPEKPGPKTGGADKLGESKDAASQPAPIPATRPSEKDIQTLASLLMACYPGMPEISANAMAQADVMREALKVIAATREAIESNHAQSDFVILSLFKLFSQSKKQVLEIIQGNPAFKKAFENSRIALE
jgi:hypothetical protein